MNPICGFGTERSTSKQSIPMLKICELITNLLDTQRFAINRIDIFMQFVLEFFPLQCTYRNSYFYILQMRLSKAFWIISAREINLTEYSFSRSHEKFVRKFHILSNIQRMNLNCL